MKITFQQDDYHVILERARTGRPYEICGVVGGQDGVARLVIPLRNAAADPRTRYQVDPAEFIRAYARLEQVGELIAIYHSHPAGAPIPSPADIAEATWPDAVYLIVGFVADEAMLRGWQIRRGTVEEVEVLVTPTTSSP